MKLFYRELGSGEPMIILHGLYGSSDNWIPLAKSFSQSFRVIVPDLRNHGCSPHADDHTYPEMVEDIRELFERTNIQRAHILGHSMGGKLALFFALSYPTCINRLIIADASPKGCQVNDKRCLSIREFHKKLIHILLSINFEGISTYSEARAHVKKHIKDKRLVSMILKNINKTKNGMAWKINLPALKNHLSHIMTGICDFEGQEKIRDFRVLFIRAGHSDYIKQNDIEYIYSVFQNVNIQTIPGAGHWLHVDQPRVLCRMVTEFCNQ